MGASERRGRVVLMEMRGHAENIGRNGKRRVRTSAAHPAQDPCAQARTLTRRSAIAGAAGAALASTACALGATSGSGAAPSSAAATGLRASLPGAPGVALASGKDSVVITHGGDPLSWCPDVSAHDNAYHIVQNMFHRLGKLDTNLEVIPDAAESWDVADDAMSVTFHLRHDLFWSDGEPLTSADVVYTYETIKASERYYLRSRLEGVESFEAPDDYTVIFHMSAPNMAILGTVSWYACFILPKHVYDVEGVTWEDNEAAKLGGTPVTSGPYTLESYVQGQSITLSANESYYQVPAIKKLIYTIISDPATQVQAIQNAETDVLEEVPSANVATLQADPSLRMTLIQAATPNRLVFNVTRTDKHLDDPAVRQAIAMCVDRDAISQKAYGGVMPPETHYYPSLLAAYSNDVDVAPAFDPQGARSVLEQAGYAADADGNYITGLTIDAYAQQGNDQAAKLIAADMAKAGLPCEVIISEMNAFTDKITKQRDFYLEIQNGFLGPDPYALKNRLGTGAPSNYGSYSNPAFDELTEQANATADDAKRAELYKQAQRELSLDIPYAPIVGYAAYTAYAAELKDTPGDGAGRWGGQEWAYASWA